MATFPETALAWANGALVAVFDAVLGPMMGWPPLVGLLLVSIVTAAGMLVVVARTSDQKAMAATKRGIHAALFEIRLFGDDPPVMLRAFGEVLVRNAHYLRLSLVPLLWMALPLVLVIAQLQAFYGYAGLTPGEAALVTVQMKPASTSSTAAAPILETPGEVRVETDAVQMVGSNEVLWRIVPDAAGTFTMTLRDASVEVTKSVVVSTRAGRRSPIRAQAGLADQFLYPSEAPLPGDSRIAAITVSYPETGIDVFGWRIHWLIVYGVMSVLCALVLARRFGVTI